MAISGHKSKEEIWHFLQPLAIAVLSTVSADGKPYAAPIYFFADHQLNFFFLTKSDTKKSQNLENNANAALTVIDRNEPRSVQTTGQVTEVDDPTLYRKMIVQISESTAKNKNVYWPPPLSKLDSEGDLIMYKFQPDWLRFADFSEDTKENIFYQVIPAES